MTATPLQRVAAGEQDAVRDCLDTYGGLVWSIARRMLGPGQEAEDAVQEIFIELWRCAGRFDPSKGGEPQFVATVARRRVVDRVRRRQRRPDSAPLPEALDDGDAIPVGDVAETQDEYERARRALDMLPADRRRVIELAVMQGHSHTEIAEQTGIPLGTVKTHVRRGLIRLREILEREPGASPP